MAAPRPCHCDDYSRGQLLRRAAARAGDGLPPIDPGMPLPAGSGLTRRSFLLRSAGLSLSVYGAGRLGREALEEGVANAAASVAAGPVLVSVFLDGGADSLSVLFPAGDADYRRLRPTLALDPAGGVAFGEDERLRWHPALGPLAALHAEGKVTTLPAIGYTHVDQSHFTSRHYWEVGATSTQLATGWLGRFLDVTGAADNPLQGLSLDGQLQPALATARVAVAAIEGPTDYTLETPHVTGRVEERMLETLERLGAPRGADPALATVGSTILQAARLREQLLPFRGFTSPVPYPEAGVDRFPRRLAGLSAMLAAGLPLRCVTVRAPGFYDTHAEQPGALDAGLRLTAATLLAFQRDLEARGLADRVLVHVWSEFGRRAAENASNGTDHGAAGAGFLIGSRVRGRMIGEFPGLTTGLDTDGNLRATSDFRGLYCALLEQWFDSDAAAVIPGAAGFARPELLR
jgi:uncharacterized protein (DUF1501 family)